MSFRLLVVPCGLALGCATLPITGSPSTGEPLSVASGIAYSSHVEKAKVGEVQHKDARGRDLGKSEVYQERLVTTSHLVWQTKQGESAIDEEDFFRIAGETETADEIQKTRQTGVLLNRIGWGGAAVGLAGLGGAWAMSGDPNLQGLSPAATIGGLVITTLGSTLIYMGLNLASPGRHHVEREEAMRTAATYNQRLAEGDLAPTGTGGSGTQRLGR